MSVTTLHPEEVRAKLRIAFGSLERFAAARNVKSQLIRDYLRGQSHVAHDIIAEAIGLEPDQLQVSRRSTNVESHSKAADAPHRLCETAK